MTWRVRQIVFPRKGSLLTHASVLAFLRAAAWLCGGASTSRVNFTHVGVWCGPVFHTSGASQDV